MPTLTGQAPVLLVGDVQKVVGYYRDALGFEVELWDVNPEHYGYAHRDGCHVHFACFADVEPRPNSAAVPPDMFDVYFYVDDVDALHRELADRGADLLQAPVEQVYGMYELRVRDPSGHILAFGQPRDAV
jgi:catechol 2,3-dioxygenase-like lactoylglutathione lyase family enzyme